MPDVQLANNTISRPPRGAGGTQPVEEGTPPMVVLQPVQVIGLVPLYDCNLDECRVLPDLDCCKRRLVFGGAGLLADAQHVPGYEHDANSFYIDVSMYAPNIASTVCIITLEKCTGRNTWAKVGNISGATTYGPAYALGSISGHPNYAGCLVSWARVIYNHGVGIYRVKFVTSCRTLVGCLYSDEFDVRKFNCNIAHGTVKFESFIQGKIGDPTKQGRVWDVCGMNTTLVGFKYAGVYDSVRLPGFFGYEKIKQYIEVMLEYQTGLQERIKDEAIQSFEFRSGYFKKDLHDRLKVYGLMADTLWVSDYNINNSDYNINRLAIVKAGNYEPVYQDKNRRRISKVTVEFKAGTQQIIKSLCCPIR